MWGCLRVLHLAQSTIASKISVTSKGVRLSEKMQLTAALCIIKFDRSNKFDLRYYGQKNSLHLKSSMNAFEMGL